MTLTKSLETAVQDREDRLDGIEWRVQRQRDALLALTAQQATDCEQLPDTLARITRVTADTLRVARVSIWRYNAGRTGIDCVDLFDASTGSHQTGASLRAADFPHYFRVLAESDVVAVDDAVADARTAEFTVPYLRPLGIASMMDVPIHLGGAVIGVLCHEQTGAVRHWTDDEKSFAIAASTLVSLAFERCERRRAESAIALQGAALNAVAHPVVIADRWANIAWINPAFTALTGYSLDEAVGRNSIDLLNAERHPVEFFRNMWAALNDGGCWRGELWNRAKDGRLFLVDQTVTPVKDASGKVTHFIAIKVDLTQQRSLEGQFLQAQKMEVVGRLAGGIAHDFNNLLTVINGTAELALGDLPDNHPARLDFERIQEAGIRAAGLTRQLLTFSRKEIVNRIPIAVAPLLDGFKGTLQRLIGEDISLAVTAHGDESTVLADRGQIEQVILNLAVNARDAMPRGGTLAIESASVELDAQFAESHVNVKPGPYVRISVTDTGEGMSDEVVTKIFEPFFTTKSAGKGTGLGLATVYAIVEKSEGSIWVESKVGAGTTFTIYLPRITAPPAEDSRAPALEHVATGETVLVVEDDEAVRAVAVRILESAGYVVLSTADAIEALQLLIDHPRPIDLIVTDVVLTGMGGRDLAIYASAIAPGTPVLFTSGHTDDLVLAHGVRENTVHFISKPFSAAALGQKVREVMNKAHEGKANGWHGDRGN